MSALGGTRGVASGARDSAGRRGLLSVETYGAAEPKTHRTLLGAGVIIVEGLNLHGVPPGKYTFVGLPLKIQGGDGAPGRAILMR